MSRKMYVYLVRRIADKGVLGVFWGSPESVWNTVDELGDPCIFEAAKIDSGAIYIDGSSEPIWQQFDDMAEEEEVTESPKDFSSYIPSESLSLLIRDQSLLRWRRFNYADEGAGIIQQVLKEIKRNV